MIDGYNNQIKYNFIPNTVYEWHTKAWCLGNLDELGTLIYSIIVAGMILTHSLQKQSVISCQLT